MLGMGESDMDKGNGPKGSKDQLKEGTMKDIRTQITAFAKNNMTLEADTLYPQWHKTWYEGARNIMFKLRLIENDFGADIILMACPNGYGTCEEQWNGINLGPAISVEQIRHLYMWMDVYCQ